MQSIYDKIDLDRYSRQIPLLHISGQLKLAESSVAVVGLGGLGSPVSYYLAAAGVGRLILVDGECVEVSNLNRQILYETEDIGLPKAVLAAKRIRGLNPLVEVVPVSEPVSRDNVAHILEGVDVIVDALDDWKARLILDEYSQKAGIPLVHGAVDGLYGQVTTIIPGKTSCLACIAPRRLPQRGCRAAIGPFVGLVATIEALEVIKLLTGQGSTLANRLLVIDGAEYRFDEVKLEPVECSKCRSLIED